MTLFLIKLALTPLLMWLVSLAARRWGPSIGGLLAGLPLTSGPISIFLFLEQGPSFAADAAIPSLVAVAGVAWFSIGYNAFAGHRPISLCATAGIISFGIAVTCLNALRPGLTLALLVAIASVITTLLTIAHGDTEHAEVEYPSWDLPVRIATATCLVIFVTASARALGPALSGILSPIPVVAWPLCVFVHWHQGEAAAACVLRGVGRGAFGVCAFYAIVALGLRQFNPLLVYVTAVGSAALLTLPWLIDTSHARNAE